MKYYTDSALVLRRYPFNEADFILTLFTKENGKVKAIAKGVRKVTSRRGGHLDLFNHVEVGLREGRNLELVTEVKTIDHFAEGKERMELLRQFYYVAELVDALILEGEAHPGIFSTLVKLYRGLGDLSISEETVERSIRKFEVVLLKDLGYWSEAIQGRQYPSALPKQKEFNQMLLREVADRDFKSLYAMEG